MGEDADVLVASTPDAAWLPAGGRADVVRSNRAPGPTSVVRLLLKRGDSVFCIPRSDSGKLDLPTRRVPPTDPHGRATVRELARDVLGEEVEPAPIGFVRNVVSAASGEYEWPTPLAHFVVWVADGSPVALGTWVDMSLSSELDDRHWFLLVRAAESPQRLP